MSKVVTSAADQQYIIWNSPTRVAYLHTRPPTPGTVILESTITGASSLFHLPLKEFEDLLSASKKISSHLCQSLSVQRCALVTTPGHSVRIKIIPLHGLRADWDAKVVDTLEFNSTYPGYCNSLNGPKSDDRDLDEVQGKIRSGLNSQKVSYDFHGDLNRDNLFARIVRGELQQWRVWEDRGHVAFLTPFPNTTGFTVLVPRKYLPSDIFSLDEDDFVQLVRAAYGVARLLKESLNADACSMIFEGYEIDYAHVKLIPVFEGRKKEVGSEEKVYWSECYEGYVTSLDGPESSDHALAKMKRRIGMIADDTCP